jgi:hypothetical protein
MKLHEEAILGGRRIFRMVATIAYADNVDFSNANFVVILSCAAAAIGISFMSGFLIFLSRRINHRHADAILTCAIFWSLISLGSVIYAAVTQIKWAQEHQLELQSGYGNPANVGPAWPWMLWAGLAVAYAALLAWTAIPIIPKTPSTDG